MKYKLFVSDFDGTLGIAPGIIEEDTVKAVKEYCARGGKFVICTGRMFQSIREICMRYGLKGLVIAYQGAMINDLDTGASIFNGGLSPTDAAEVTEKLQAEGVSVMADIDDKLYYEKKDSDIEFYEKAVHVVGIKVENLSKHIKACGKVVSKVAAVCSPETAKALTEKYARLYDGKLIFNNGVPKLIEVINPKCSKGEAVRFLSKYYGVPYSEIIAVGDSTNDIQLLDGEWYGVATGDCREELKKYAKEITVPYSEKPVKVLLEKYCL